MEITDKVRRYGESIGIDGLMVHEAEAVAHAWYAVVCAEYGPEMCECYSHERDAGRCLSPEIAYYAGWCAAAAAIQSERFEALAVATVALVRARAREVTQ